MIFCSQCPIHHLTHHLGKHTFLSSFALSQALELRPLASFFETIFNEKNKIPMDAWLTAKLNKEEEHENRLKALGNIAVPQAAQLASEILLRISHTKQ